MEPAAGSVDKRIALVGNPNVGKTSLFNALTGLRQKVGNYPGVTVERKTGRLSGPAVVELIDLPGTYSLTPRSLDEEIAVRVLTNRLESERPVDAVACVMDATNLERNLNLAVQVVELGLPTVIILNMMDEAERDGLQIDVERLGLELGVPVMPTSALRGRGLVALRRMLAGPLIEPPRRRAFLTPEDRTFVEPLAEMLRYSGRHEDETACYRAAVSALTGNSDQLSSESPSFHEAVLHTRNALTQAGRSFPDFALQARYRFIHHLSERVVHHAAAPRRIRLTDAIDAWLTHPVLGPIAFLLILSLIFQAVFTWATPAMDMIESGFQALGSLVRTVLPAGPMTDLLVDGAIAGVGSVLVFLPQIVLLFLLLGILEDTGYMARAAFVADKLMGKLGLSGRSVVPLVSGYACAVPAIMATRTIENHRDRLVTMMVIPLMSCSARLPIYTLFIGAFIPAGTLLGFIGVQGLALFSLYLLSTVMALTAAWVMNKRWSGGQSSLLMLELPVYRLPLPKQVVLRMYERSKLFITKAGKIIFLMSIILWFLASYPVPDTGRYEKERRQIEMDYRSQVDALQTSGMATRAKNLMAEAGLDVHAAPPTDEETLRSRRDALIREVDNREAGERVRNSFIGRAGRLIEPVMQPLGFDWKISAGILAAFAAREVLVSTLATLYSVGDANETSITLHEQLRQDRNPETGRPVFTPLVAISLMVFFMLASQCMSTLAITRRETNSLKWPAFMFTYMTVLAYVFSLLVYQGGRLLGIG